MAHIADIQFVLKAGNNQAEYGAERRKRKCSQTTHSMIYGKSIFAIFWVCSKKKQMLQNIILPYPQYTMRILNTLQLMSVP